MLLGPAFILTFGVSFAIYIAYIPSLRFGGDVSSFFGLGQ